MDADIIARNGAITRKNDIYKNSGSYPVPEEGSKLDTPLAESFMPHLNAAPVQQFLDVSETQWEAVVQPDGVPDDGHRESVAVGLGIVHGQSDCPDRVKATQPKRGHSLGEVTL
jgi:hypothetical protein